MRLGQYLIIFACFLLLLFYSMIITGKEKGTEIMVMIDNWHIDRNFLHVIVINLMAVSVLYEI